MTTKTKSIHASKKERPSAPDCAEPIALMTVQEVAAVLRESTRTTRRRIERGELKTRRIGRGVRIERGELSAFIAAH